MSPVNKKMVIVGDTCTGKTSLILRFLKNEFHNFNVPTVFENYDTDIEDEGKRVRLAIWDTSGSEYCCRQRPLFYPDTDVIVILFSIGNPDSLDNVYEMWIPEVKQYCPNVPIILLGNQKDLRNDVAIRSELSRQVKKPVTFDQGCAMAEKIGAITYQECSAKEDVGVKEVFEAATIAALMTKTEEKKEKKSIKSRLSFGLL